MTGPAWLVLTVPPPPRGEEHLLVDALRRVGARAVEREAGGFLAHFPPPADVEALLAEVRSALRASSSLREPRLAWRREAEPWAGRWREEMVPRRVTPRLAVAPADGEVTDGEAADGDGATVVVRLEPGVGFGTASHPTTRACLRQLDPLVEPGCRLADVGAGSGILAIAAALLGAAEVVALESDAAACEAAGRNSARNGVERRVDVRCATADAAVLGGLGRFDGVAANLELGIVAPLLGALHGALREGGWLVVSGILRAERDGLVRRATAAGLALQAEDVEDGWWTGRFRRISPT